MSLTLMTFAVEDAAVDPLGAKEAVAMAVEHLGWVRVLAVEVREDEQLALDGTTPARAVALPGCRGDSGGQDQDSKGRWPAHGPSRRLIVCANCAHYRQDPGWDDAGQAFYGRCAKNGKPVYRLFDQCGAHLRKGARA